MKQLYLASLGCTKNLVDSEVMLGKLKDYAIAQDPAQADLLIVNTCGFIESAKQESIETILELHENRKSDSILAVSGCLSERYRQQLQEELPEVDIFTGVGDYDHIDEMVQNRVNRFSDRVYLADGIEDRILTGSNYHAYIKLSEGCNQKCSFCAIPGFKGRLQSRTIDSVVDEVKRLAAKGIYDFSFVSQDSSSFGRDLGDRRALIKLIYEIERVPGVESARVHYLYPATTTKEMIDVIAASPVFHTYFDMPIQHVDDGMLKKMKRGLGAEGTIELLQYMKSKPESFLRSAVIVGHPGEDAQSYERMRNFIEEFGFDRLSVFAYSDEEDTAAFEMDDKCDRQAIEMWTQGIEALTQPDYTSLQGSQIKAVIEDYSTEHDLLLSARPLSWAYEVDGEILVNDTDDKPVDFGKTYTLQVTEVTGGYPLAKVVWT